MEREIKFRGKRIGNGEWVYGSYTQMREDDHNECFKTKPHKTYHRIWQWEAGDWNMGGYANYEVIHETVGQFTGLKDKNGVEIYEGDIVEFTRAQCRGVSRGTQMFVSYQTYCFCGFGFDETMALTKRRAKECFVVGNIHNNPESIKD